ncbi:hypothetical protein ABE61_00190 [Lysinibacillus sphaericus]|uniref:hypothetical protein n=1 Tax=Lysinibacillus sphaericus TaxID=1421 RepID=UPI0018CDD677|nr:hypothetical protein [Lysinibacillus sphaericus]MBG9452548.1 hypothetical protein [Lysinibacillus sphaericus]MBG9477289.1 hypothetical protein [Lysinibacillus sphaericus]MBG9592795.1 hypothetical protein [Lysinibacillus sphaericus]
MSKKATKEKSTINSFTTKLSKMEVENIVHAKLQRDKHIDLMKTHQEQAQEIEDELFLTFQLKYSNERVIDTLIKKVKESSDDEMNIIHTCAFLEDVKIISIGSPEKLDFATLNQVNNIDLTINQTIEKKYPLSFLGNFFKKISGGGQ